MPAWSTCNLQMANLRELPPALYVCCSVSAIVEHTTRAGLKPQIVVTQLQQ